MHRRNMYIPSKWAHYISFIWFHCKKKWQTHCWWSCIFLFFSYFRNK